MRCLIARGSRIQRLPVAWHSSLPVFQLYTVAQTRSNNMRREWAIIKGSMVMPARGLRRTTENATEGSCLHPPNTIYINFNDHSSRNTTPQPADPQNQYEDNNKFRILDHRQDHRPILGMCSLTRALNDTGKWDFFWGAIQNCAS